MYLNGEEFKKELRELKLDENNNNDNIQKCINSLLCNKNIMKNYLFFIKYNNSFNCSIDSFDKKDIESIFNFFKERFTKYKETNEKKINNINNKDNEKDISNEDNEKDINNKHNEKDINNKHNEKDISNKNDEKDINNKDNEKENIRILNEFLQVLLFIYYNEDELDKFIVENIKLLGLNDKTKFSEFFKNFKLKKRTNFINLCQKLLEDIEAKNTEFKEKEEIEFYEYLFREFNYYKNNLFCLEEKKYALEIPKKDFKNQDHLEKFISLFNKQKNEKIIDEMIHFLYNLYNLQKNLNLLYKKIKDTVNFNAPENSNIFKLFLYTFNEFEKDYVVKVKPLYSLCKKNIFTLKFNNQGKDEILKFYGNTTINEIYDFLIRNKNYEKEFFDINIKEKENQKKGESYYNKTLNELKNKNLEITITKKDINPDKLIEKENGNKFTKKFQKVLEEWFNYFSKGEKIMNRNEIAECMSILSGKKDKPFIEKRMKIYFFLKKYSDNFNYISNENFFKFYKEIILENNEEKMKDVWNNIKNMNLRPDLSKIPKEIENDYLPRYYLSNKTKEFDDSFIMEIFNEKLKYSTNEELFNFISFLSTNEKIYTNILNNFNSKENMKLTKKLEEFINNLYTLIIIESIIEDVVIIYDYKENKILPLISADNIDKKSNFS